MCLCFLFLFKFRKEVRKSSALLNTLLFFVKRENFTQSQATNETKQEIFCICFGDFGGVIEGNRDANDNLFIIFLMVAVILNICFQLYL